MVDKEVILSSAMTIVITSVIIISKDVKKNGFSHMVDYSISLLRTFFLYLPGSSVCNDLGKCNKSYNKLCYKQINVYFIFISIKNFHKT